MRTMTILFVAALIVAVRPAAAQEAGKVGLTMGYPAAVGVLWHVTDRLAIQPELSFSHNRTEATFESTLIFGTSTVVSSTSTTETEGWGFAPGLNLLLYVGKWDNVSAYLSPGVSYSRSSITSISTATAPLTGARTETRKYVTDGYGVRGVFGVQYTPHPKFSVFGEIGARYARSDGPISSTRSSTSAFGNTTAVGVVFYF